MEDLRRANTLVETEPAEEEDKALTERLLLLQQIREDLKKSGHKNSTDHFTQFLSWIIVFTGFALISSVVWNRFVVDFAAPWVALPHITAVQMMCLKWLINYFSPFHK